MGFLMKLVDSDRPINFPLEYRNIRSIMKVGLHLGPDPRILGSQAPPLPHHGLCYWTQDLIMLIPLVTMTFMVGIDLYKLHPIEKIK